MFKEVKKEDAPGKEVFRVIFLSDELVRCYWYKGNGMINKNSPIFMGLPTGSGGLLCAFAMCFVGALRVSLYNYQEKSIIQDLPV